MNKKKKKLGKRILGGLLSFAKGATISNPIISMVIGGVEGIVKGVAKTKTKNIESEQGGVGKVDHFGASGAIVGGVLTLIGAFAIFKGWLTMDQVSGLFSLWLESK